jgi:hypothetical protein
LCKGKGHLARFCVNTSASAPKRHQPNNDDSDKAFEVKRKANLKRRDGKKKARPGAKLVNEAEKEDKTRESAGYPLTLALPGTARERNQKSRRFRL